MNEPKEIALPEGFLSPIFTSDTGGIFTKMTFSPQAKLFMLGGDTPVQNPLIEILWYKIVRRNYENVYDPNKLANPTCHSLDTVRGSHPRILRVLNGKEEACYGECTTCIFAQFNTQGIWNGPPGKAPNCSNYILLLCVHQNKLVVVHVPPTGVKSVGQGIKETLGVTGKGIYSLSWKLLGSGGGKQGKFISIVPHEHLVPERTKELSSIAQANLDLFRDYVIKFCEGVPEKDPVPAVVTDGELAF